MKLTHEGLRVGAAFGAPILLRPSVLMLAPWTLFWALRATSTPELANRLIAIVLLLGSVLVHEFAHAAVAKRFGATISSINVAWFGGFVQFWWPLSARWREAAIALAGPFANLLIAGAAALVATYYVPASRHTFTALSNLYFINLGLGLFNLLPALPLDGGHVLRAALSTTMSRGRAGWIAGWLGVIAGALIALLAMYSNNIWTFLVGGFLAVSAFAELQRMRHE